MDKLQPIPREHIAENFKWRDWLTKLKDRIDTISLPSGVTTGTSILAGNGSGGFTNITIGAGLSFSSNTLSLSGGGSGTVTSIATAGLLAGGTITSSGTITTNMNTGKLVGRSTAGSGVMEEITVGSGLSLSAGTLSATGGGGGVSSISVTSPITSTGGTTPSIGMVNQGTSTTVLHGNAAGNPTFGAVVLTTDVSGTLPIANGGTGLTAVGANNTVLTSNGSTASWQAPSGGGGVDYSIYAFAARH